MLQKVLGLRAPFDVISGDASLVRGSHGRIPAGDEQRPVLLTSWPADPTGVSRLQDVMSLLLHAL